MSVRICSKCEVEYPLTDEFFYKYSLPRVDYKYICKECEKSSVMNYYHDPNNTKKIKARVKEYSSREEVKQRVNEMANEAYRNDPQRHNKQLIRWATRKIYRGCNLTEAKKEIMQINQEQADCIREKYDTAMEMNEGKEDRIESHHIVPFTEFDLTDTDQRAMVSHPDNIVFITHDQHIAAHSRMSQGYVPVFNAVFVKTPVGPECYDISIHIDL